MKLNTYCFASIIREQGPLYEVMQAMRARLVEKEIKHTIPEMGWHLPLIPPFRASDDEAAFFVGAIGLGRKCFTANATPILVLSKSISMFENADEDALILVIEMGQDFGEAIEDLRGMMDHRTDMKYPYNFMLNFVTVAHGQRLAQKIEKAGGIHAVFGGINPCTTTGLEYPTIQQKTSRGWVPVKG